MGFLRAYGRLLIFVVTICIGMSFILLLSLLLGKNMTRSMRIRRFWLIFITKVLGLEDEMEGEVPTGPCLYVSNHRSLSDPMVALKHIYAYPLAKAEVNRYPLIGLGARLTGVLYVVRESASSRNVAKQSIQDTLSSGWSVLIYPEGTTTISLQSKDFKKGSFEIAAESRVPIVPVAIEYQDQGDHWSNRSLLKQYQYQFGKARCNCKISFGPQIIESDPLIALDKTKQWIDSKLIDFRQDFDSKRGR